MSILLAHLVYKIFVLRNLVLLEVTDKSKPSESTGNLKLWNVSPPRLVFVLFITVPF